MKTLVIVNPAASGGKAIGDYESQILPLLKKMLKDFDVNYTKGPGDAWKIASAATGYDRVISVGGDGTLNEIVNGLKSSERNLPIVGIIGVGTGNDLMRTLKTPEQYEETVKIATGEQYVLADLLEVDFTDFEGVKQKRFAVNVVGMGLDAAVARRLNSYKRKSRGKAGYVRAFLIEFFKSRKVPMTVEADNGKHNGKYFIVAAGNGEYFGGGMRICPGALLDDGMLKIVEVGCRGKFHVLMNFPKIFAGTHLGVKGVYSYDTRAITVESSAPVPIEMDGEVVGTLPIRISVRQKQVKFTSSVPS